MWNAPARVTATAVVATLVLLAFAFEALAQPSVLESGFQVREFSKCAGFPGPASFGISDAVCGSGGAFGDYVYYTVVFSEDEAQDHVARMSMQGREEFFANPSDFNSSLAVSAASSFMGERLVVGGRCRSTGFDGHALVTSAGGLDRCTSVLSGNELPFGPGVFDRDGQLGYDMFVNDGGSVYRASGFAGYAVFANSSGNGEIEFGPGGAWGDDLYVAGGGVVDSAGNLTMFPHSFRDFDWPEGPGWDGDMMDLDAAGNIWRVHPDGTASLFATGASGELVACGGHLWIMRAEACVRISPRGGKSKAH